MGGTSTLKKHRYVLGFLFDDQREKVALITKNPSRPEQQWQKGLLNGIGGGIEAEQANEAMARECEEECGLKTKPDDWVWVTVMGGSDWECFVFAHRVDKLKVSKTTREEVAVYSVNDILTGKYRTVDNVPYLIALSTCALVFGRSTIQSISY